MRVPIQYAFSYPERLASSFPRLSFADYNTLTFEEPDPEKFRNLQLSYYAMTQGGNLPCVLNAANEVVVDAFLNDRVGFLEMSDIIEKAMERVFFIKKPTFDDYVTTDKESRRIALELIKKK